MANTVTTPDGVRPLTPQEEIEFAEMRIKAEQFEQSKKISDIRNDRNRLLIESDWIVIKSFESNQNLLAY